MTKYTGKNATIEFGGTAFACLNGLTITGSASIPSIECSQETGDAVTHKAVGARDWRVSTTIVLEPGITEVDALKPGTSAAFNAYPGGKLTGQAEFAWTTGIIETAEVANGPSTFTALDVTVQCDGDAAIASYTAV